MAFLVGFEWQGREIFGLLCGKHGIVAEDRRQPKVVSCQFEKHAMGGPTSTYRLDQRNNGKAILGCDLSDSVLLDHFACQLEILLPWQLCTCRCIRSKHLHSESGHGI